MSAATVSLAGFDDFDRHEFDLIVADFDEPARSHRPSRAAQRRAGREQIDRGLGINRHRSHEREV